MKSVWQVLFGLALGATGLTGCAYQGLLVNGYPGWRTGLLVLLVVAVTQWLAYWIFRRRIVLQVIVGLFLCTLVAVWLIYSRISFSWEVRYPDGSNPITWRSDVLLLFLIAITQGVSFLIFRNLKPGREGSSASPLSHGSR